MNPLDRTGGVAELLDGARDGDEESWLGLVARCAPIAVAAARGAGAREADVDDVCQATWIALHRHLPFLRSAEALGSWIRTTTRREVGRLRRRAARKAELEELAAGDSSATSGGETDALVRMELALAVRDALDRLGEPCGGLLRGLFLEPEEPTYSELAERLGMPAGSVGPTRQRCLAKLARLLEGLGYGPDGA